MSDAFECPGSCPFVAARDPALDFPIGQLRRTGTVDPDQDVDETKRNVLKLLAVAGIVGAGAGGLVGGTLQFVQPPVIGISSYPRVQLIDVDASPLTVAKVESEYSVDTSDDIIFYYPLRNEPNFFLNLAPANGQAPSDSNPGAWGVPGGIGTHGSIVAFSAICQHLGCPAPAISYYPPGTCSETFNTGPPSQNSSPNQSFYIHCSCHGSTYDPTHSAANLTGPAVLPLPQVVLETDANGNIFAVGENGPPVNGHLSTLTGDYGVASAVPLAKETPVILCSFGLKS
jgi:Rieske Fe-S protein